ncbi:MAG: DEAD/DEAH box helicase family protein [Thaumarchaeota archaeon]|nr:DEAD/DEAH box helicase family protein [Nitrososphaerota archaeon]
MAKVSEYKTRKEKIDVLLSKTGWDVRDRTKIIQEVDTKQSDFRAGNYKTVSQTLKNPEESAYADYLLLDSHGLPLAVIEAKRTDKDYLLGQKQAEDYSDDIKKQTGKDVFIFMTNGYDIWFWNRPNEGPRAVSGFHDRNSLERLRFQNISRKDFSEVSIRKDIVDRPYQIESVKRVLEGIEKGRRKFLIVQATGTGKTRVAMALIDVLLRANRAQRILFLTDRKELRNQAYGDNGFKAFFPNESKTKVFSGKVEKTSRLYASTIQTFMECYQEFSPGDFDVIISDEAHRSIYNKWKEVFTYFDAIEIGLTATPSELIERDTFRFFNCEERTPTYLYTYDEAVKDGWLADYQVYVAQTHFQIEGIQQGDVPDQIKKKLLEEQGVTEDEINFEGTDIEKKVAVIGTNEAIAKEFMEECLRDKAGTLPAKTIIFAVSKKHATRLWEAFEKLYPEYKGRLVRRIVSEDPRAEELLKQFKTESFPRIAISVDMLDTGVDIPEVCNLVFAKPVFSKIKFWQMIGRGTRHDRICKDKDLLPDGKKENFLIFDFWNNFDWHNMHPEGKEAKPSEAVPTKIFLTRLQQLNHLLEAGDKRAGLIKEKLAGDINALPRDSISVREHMRDVEKALSPEFWDRVGLDQSKFLKTRISPLMRYQKDINLNEASWTLKIEKLNLAILREDRSEIDRLKDEIGEWVNSLPTTIREVKDKQELINRVLRRQFWDNLTFDDAQMLLKEFTPMMRYKQPEPRPTIILDIDDVVQKREFIEYGPLPIQEYVTTYIDKVEKKIKQLAEQHPTIKKIEHDEVLTEDDLGNLEKTLNSPELYITEETLQKAYAQHKGTLVQFIKKVLGLYEFPDSRKQIEDAFKAFIIEKNYLNSDQVNFLRTIQTVFMKKHHIEYSDLFEPPFTNFGINAPIPLFADEDLKEVIQLCNNLEKEVYAHART